MLQDPQYDKLMNCICYNQEDYKRFRQILINIVLATDIMDKELGAARKARWNIAFGTEGAEQPEEPHKVSLNRKATIVLEHLIQASDVSHTMQHWCDQMVLSHVVSCCPLFALSHFPCFV